MVTVPSLLAADLNTQAEGNAQLMSTAQQIEINGVPALTHAPHFRGRPRATSAIEAKLYIEICCRRSSNRSARCALGGAECCDGPRGLQSKDGPSADADYLKPSRGENDSPELATPVTRRGMCSPLVQVHFVNNPGASTRVCPMPIEKTPSDGGVPLTV